MRQVYVARDASEANWIRSALERAGIEATIQGDQPADAVPELVAAAPSLTVQVRDADEADACRLIEGLLAEGGFRPSIDASADMP